MRRYSFAISGLALALVLFGAGRAWALGSEEFGNEPLAEANYTDWKGVAVVVNDKSRIYQMWVNGNEHFYYSGKTKELNAVLAGFAKVEVKHHVVVLRSGPAVTKSFHGTVIPYNWQLHLVGGIAKFKAVDDVEDLDWQKDPVLTIQLGDGIELKSLELPEGITLAVRKEDEKQKGQQALIDFVAKWNDQQKKQEK